jgi:hypothetical protein
VNSTGGGTKQQTKTATKQQQNDNKPTTNQQQTNNKHQQQVIFFPNHCFVRVEGEAAVAQEQGVNDTGGGTRMDDVRASIAQLLQNNCCRVEECLQ